MKYSVGKINNQIAMFMSIYYVFILVWGQKPCIPQRLK